MVEMDFKPIRWEITQSGDHWIKGTVTLRCTSDALGDRDHPTDIEVEVGAVYEDGEWVAADGPGDLDAALTGRLDGLRQIAPYLAAEAAQSAAWNLAAYANAADDLSHEQREYIRSALA